ncbi:MAG: winged helix-turn-helix domain-containing protein [Pseudomonadota bacterium]
MSQWMLTARIGGAAAYEFRGDLWSCTRVAQILQWEFGITHSTSHLSRLLRSIGWTRQVPITRAIQRDEEAIAQWRSRA